MPPEKRQTTDPRKLGGDIAGPGGPHDEGQVVFDTTNAVIQDYFTVARLDDASDPLATGLLIEGRINRTKDRAKVLVIVGADGVAAIVTELMAYLVRAGATGAEGIDLVIERLQKLQAEGNAEHRGT